MLWPALALALAACTGDESSPVPTAGLTLEISSSGGPSAGPVPIEVTPRDLVGNAAIGPGDPAPEIVFEIVFEIVVAVPEDTEDKESAGDGPVDDATEPADTVDEPAAQADEPDTSSNTAGIVVIALGILTIGAGAWAYRQAGKSA